MAQEVYLKALRFDGTNYFPWKSWMEYHLNSLPLRMWDIIKSSYTGLQCCPTTVDEVKNHENNVKESNILVSSLSGIDFFKIN